MNKYTVCKYLVLILFFSALVAFHMGGLVETAGAAPPAPVDAKPLFKKNCARCHGADGSADTESGRLYETPDITGGKLRNASSAKLVRIVTKGKESMPAFGKKLTAAQISALVAYMKTL